MEGTVRFLLITMLATAATAKHEYNSQEIQAIHEEIRGLVRMTPIAFKNMDTLVEWIVTKASATDVTFQITDLRESSGEDCGEGPALIIGNGPEHCLFGMSFVALTADQDDSLQLSILFQNSQDDSETRVMVSELYKKPENPAEDLSNVVSVAPILSEQLRRARNKASFIGAISWVRNLLEKGIYAGTDPSNDQHTVGDKKSIAYTTFPVVMDGDILDQVLEIR